MKVTEMNPPGSATPRHRKLQTLSVFVMYFSVGILNVIGPAFIDLQILFNTHFQVIGTIFLVNGAGYAAGGALGGFLVDRVNHQLTFAAVGLLASVTMATAPWTQHAAIFIPYMGICVGLTAGVIEAVSPPCLLGLWLQTKYQDAMLLFPCFLWSLGSTLSPLILQPFLAKKSQNCNMSGGLYNDTGGLYNDTGGLSPSNSAHFAAAATNIEYGFLLIALIVLMCSAIPLAVFFITKPSLRPLPMSFTSEQAKIKEDKCFKLRLYLPLSLFFAFYVGMENIVSGLIASFVRVGLNWEPYKGSLITSIFQATIGVGRFVAMPLTRILKPRGMILSCLIVITGSLAVMMSLLHVHEVITWLGVAMIGMGMGPLFSSGFNWASRYISVTGCTSAVVLIASSIGSMVLPALGSYLFETLSYMTTLYLTLGVAVVELLVFLLMHCFASSHGELLSGEALSQHSNCGYDPHCKNHGTSPNGDPLQDTSGDHDHESASMLKEEAFS